MLRGVCTRYRSESVGAAAVFPHSIVTKLPGHQRTRTPTIRNPITPTIISGTITTLKLGFGQNGSNKYNFAFSRRSVFRVDFVASHSTEDTTPSKIDNVSLAAIQLARVLDIVQGGGGVGPFAFFFPTESVKES